MGAFNQAHQPCDERQADPGLSRREMADEFAAMFLWWDVSQLLRAGDVVSAYWASEDELTESLRLEGLRIVVEDDEGFVEALR